MKINDKKIHLRTTKVTFQKFPNPDYGSGYLRNHNPDPDPEDQKITIHNTDSQHYPREKRFKTKINIHL